MTVRGWVGGEENHTRSTDVWLQIGRGESADINKRREIPIRRYEKDSSLEKFEKKEEFLNIKGVKRSKSITTLRLPHDSALVEDEEDLLEMVWVSSGDVGEDKN